MNNFTIKILNERGGRSTLDAILLRPVHSAVMVRKHFSA